MFEVSVSEWFSAAHRLRGYRGRCEALHGHNWKVKVTISSNRLDNIGLVADFKVLKTRLNEVLTGLDHKYLNDLVYFKKIYPVRKKRGGTTELSNGVNPTSENIAKYIYDKLESQLKIKGLRLKDVTVWESPDCCAKFYK